MSTEKERRRNRTDRVSGADTRERVMDVAEVILMEEGYLGVSLEQVAKDVGVTKPALYYHFPEGKEQLFVAIAHRALKQHREGMERAIASVGDGEGRLRAIARWLMADRDPQQPMGELRDLGRFVDERYQVELAEGFYGALYSPIRRVVAMAIESGEFRDNDPDFLTWSFLGLVSGMLEVLRAPSGSPALKAVSGGENTADQMVDLFLNGVLS